MLPTNTPPDPNPWEIGWIRNKGRSYTGRAYLPLQHHQDNQKKGLHTRPRGQESGGEDPPAKILKPFRVTRPREGEAKGDNPPSKVRKSVQWMKSLLGLARPLQEPSSGQGTGETREGTGERWGRGKIDPGKQGRGMLRNQDGTRSQSRTRTGTPASQPTSTINGGGEVRKRPKVYVPSIDLIMTGGLLLYLLYLTKQTKEKRRKRPRSPRNSITSHQTYWKKYGWILTILVMGMLSSAQARLNTNARPNQPGEEFGLNHRFTAYDCDHPTAVQALKLPAHCLTPKTDTDNINQTTNLLTCDRDKYKILQKATYYEFDAHQCIQTRSRFFYTCVWKSHSVIAGVPETEQVDPPTIEFCRQAVTSQSYVTITGNTVPLRTDGLPTYIPEIIAGELTVTNGVATCVGEEMKY